MDEKRDETEVEGDLAVDDETAAQVTGGTKNELRRPEVRVVELRKEL